MESTPTDYVVNERLVCQFYLRSRAHATTASVRESWVAHVARCTISRECHTHTGEVSCSHHSKDTSSLHFKISFAVQDSVITPLKKMTKEKVLKLLDIQLWDTQMHSMYAKTHWYMDTWAPVCSSPAASSLQTTWIVRSPVAVEYDQCGGCPLDSECGRADHFKVHIICQLWAWVDTLCWDKAVGSLGMVGVSCLVCQAASHQIHSSFLIARSLLCGYQRDEGCSVLLWLCITVSTQIAKKLLPVNVLLYGPYVPTPWGGRLRIVVIQRWGYCKPSPVTTCSRALECMLNRTCLLATAFGNHSQFINRGIDPDF